MVNGEPGVPARPPGTQRSKQIATQYPLDKPEQKAYIGIVVEGDRMLNLADTPQFQDAEKAREFLENLRWPNGPICPHCSCTRAYKLTAKPESKKPVRPGVYKCHDCEQQFTVTVNTIFEDSHIPLHKWLLAIHLLCASKKGMPAHQLHRMLPVTYKTAWFMAHRIRHMMSQPSFKQKLTGIIESDETYVGGKRKNQGGRG